MWRWRQRSAEVMHLQAKEHQRLPENYQQLVERLGTDSLLWPQMELILLTPQSCTFGVQNWNTMSFCCMNHPGYDTLSWRPQETNRGLLGKLHRKDTFRNKRLLPGGTGQVAVTWWMNIYRDLETAADLAQWVLNIPCFHTECLAPSGKVLKELLMTFLSCSLFQTIQPCSFLRSNSNISCSVKHPQAPELNTWPHMFWGTLLRPLFSHLQTEPNICVYAGPITSLWAHEEKGLLISNSFL